MTSSRSNWTAPRTRLQSALHAALPGFGYGVIVGPSAVSITNGSLPDLRIERDGEGWRFEGSGFGADDVSGVVAAVKGAIERRRIKSSNESNRESK
jgi:hypothetical protein